MDKSKKTLGILGGLGPMASVYFYELITRHTLALRDQDHLDVIVLSGASTPDRTSFITGKSDKSPLDAMIKGVRTLYNAGAEIIAVPCNTAHYFFDELSKAVPVNVLNIVRETTEHAKRKGACRLGVLATDGTLMSGSYKHECERLGMEYVSPADDDQKVLMDIIYKSIKQSSPPDIEAFNAIVEHLFKNGCDHIILGCTELSLIPQKRVYGYEKMIDSLSVLAKNAITLCGAIPCGFDDIYNT